MRTLLLAAYITLFVPLQGQNTQSVTLDQLIQTAVSRNPEIINDSTRKEIVLNVTRNWYNWLYCINATAILNEYYDLLADLDRIARLRYKSGDIDYIQFTTSLSLLAEINTNREVFANKSRQYKNSIMALTLNESEIFPYNTQAELYEINKNPSVEPSSDSLNHYSEFIRNIEIENLHLELENLFIRLGYFRSVGLPFSEGIRETALARLKSEDIEFLEYAGFMERSLKIQLEYNEILNQYNQCAIQLEEYAY